ncbi:probable basic-leucine zipper transcription factor D, partial [Monomorium pharaonis]|uniref:probable basic-leucine zipper transcription factor D n=1 Tax=Monomorium pharaonis TaxID=307658 RepID=UPI00174634EC
QYQARSPGDGKLLAHPSNTAIKLSPGHHSTLPRKKTLLLDAVGRPASNSSSSGASIQQQQFQRGQQLRRSCLSPTQQQQQQQQQLLLPHHQHRQQESSLHFEYFVPRSVSEFNLAAAVTDIAVPPPPASVLRPSSAIAPVATGVIGTTSQTRLLDGGSGGACNIATRSREKMVTFEDEGVSCGVTSTPTRKNLPTLDNVFM